VFVHCKQFRPSLIFEDNCDNTYNAFTYNDFTYNDFTYIDFTYKDFTYNDITYKDFTFKDNTNVLNTGDITNSWLYLSLILLKNDFTYNSKLQIFT